MKKLIKKKITPCGFCLLFLVFIALTGMIFLFFISKSESISDENKLFWSEIVFGFAMMIGIASEAYFTLPTLKEWNAKSVLNIIVFVLMIAAATVYLAANFRVMLLTLQKNNAYDLYQAAKEAGQEYATLRDEFFAINETKQSISWIVTVSHSVWLLCIASLPGRTAMQKATEEEQKEEI